MSRLVKLNPPDHKFEVVGFASEKETYIEQVVKYIPVEIIGGYIAINGFASTLPKKMISSGLWFSFIFCAVLTPFYFFKLAKPGDAKLSQMIISFISFLLWSYSVTGDSGVFGKANGIDIYYSPIASILLVVFTMISPFFTQKATP